jgi:hypothetical protein
MGPARRASFRSNGVDMQPLDTLSFILNHPLGRQHRLSYLQGDGNGPLSHAGRLPEPETAHRFC